jgi:hypothetical protein
MSTVKIGKNYEPMHGTPVHSFGHILSKKHELSRAFGPEKPALSFFFFLSFGRFTKNSRFFIEYNIKPVL